MDMIIKIPYDYLGGDEDQETFEYPVFMNDAYNALSEDAVLDEEDCDIDPMDIDYEKYMDALREIFRDDAIDMYLDEKEYNKDPYAYYGLSRKDFL
jgi:hypothetical protein